MAKTEAFGGFWGGLLTRFSQNMVKERRSLVEKRRPIVKERRPQGKGLGKLV
jgi:hypothetical protein